MKIAILAVAFLVLCSGCKDDPAVVDAWYAKHQSDLAHTESEVQKMGALIEKKGMTEMLAAYLVVIEQIGAQWVLL